MQHHGAPTRLLDWTRSAYVGAFFALDESDGDCALWAIDNDWCERTANEIARRKMPNAVHNVLEHDGFLRELSHIWGNQNKNSEWSFVFPVRPKRSNVRLSIQQGLFLCPMISSMTFMDNLMGLAQRNSN